MNAEDASLPCIGEILGWFCMGGGNCINGIEDGVEVLLQVLVVARGSCPISYTSYMCRRRV